MRIVFYFFIFVLLANNSLAAQEKIVPSFDCNKNTSNLEKLICSDALLSELDSQLDKKFKEIKLSNKESINDLVDGQKKWLEERNEICKNNNGKNHYYDLDCLQHLYQQRIEVLSYPELVLPFTDKNIDKAIARLRTMNPEQLNNITTDENREELSILSCRFFEKDPKAASITFATYFGSTKDSWTPLCYSIDIAELVPEVAKLLDALETISGSSTGCDGTMSFGHRRSVRIARMLAAVDPYPTYKSKIYSDDALGYKPDLKHWSQQGNWEKRQYDNLQPLWKNANKALQKYYLLKFRVSKAQAKVAAESHIHELITFLAERTGASSTPSYLSLCFDKDDLDQYLKSRTMPRKNCPYENFFDMSKEANLRRFLGLAIVNSYPIEVIKKLIADGAELDQKRIEINFTIIIVDTPLMLAAPYPEILSLLLQKGAMVNIQNDIGKTALIYAIQEKNLNSVSTLIKFKADVNVKTFADINCTALKAGERTPLMYAAWQSTPNIVKALLDAGADINAKDTNGETSYDYLKKNEALSSAELLELKKLLSPV